MMDEMSDLNVRCKTKIGIILYHIISQDTAVDWFIISYHIISYYSKLNDCIL